MGERVSERALDDPIFHDPDAARAYLEARRWSSGPECPECSGDQITRIGGSTSRPGLLQCSDEACRRQFTVTSGTYMAHTKLTPDKWLLAERMLHDGAPVNRIRAATGMTYKAAFDLCERIRAAVPGLPPRHDFGRKSKLDHTGRPSLS